MFNIEKTDYGYKLTFGDFIQVDEMKQWLEESKSKLASSPDKFEILVDMRTLKPLPQDAQEVMQEGQKLYKMSGMERSCVILDNPTTRMQFIRIAKETGIYAFERYVDASSTPNWEEVAIAWLTEEKDPDA